MTPEEVLELANSPEVPKFTFGSSELAAFTKAHVDPITGECFKFSGWYVVIHDSPMVPTGRFRVLSYWHIGRRVPFSFDVPEGCATSSG